MANDCLVLKYKGAVDGSNLPYVDKGVVLFDNSITPTQTNQVNSWRVIPTSTVTCVEGAEFVRGSNYIRMSTDTPANSKYTFLYDLNAITELGGAQDAGYAGVVSNFKYLLRDVIRTVNLITFTPFSTIVEGDLNIANIGALKKINTFAIAGSQKNEWYGDIVELADNLRVGRDYTTHKVCVCDFSNNSTIASDTKIKLNGTSVKTMYRYFHIVFKQDGYDVYNMSSGTALDDYSGYTPVYSK